MFDSLNLNPGSFGLDISDRSLKLVQLKKGKQGPCLWALNQIALPSGIIRKGEVKDAAKLGSYIKKLTAKTGKLDSRYVAVSLPEEKSFLRVLQMPRMSDQDLKKAVRYEAENYIPFSLDKVYLDSEAITCPKPTGEEVEVLITAMPKKIVDPYVKAVKAAGLVPFALETESQAAARALTKDELTGKPIFLIDFGATSTSFSVYYGDCLRFASFIPVSSEDFTLAVAAEIGKSREEAEALKKLHGLSGKGVTGGRIAEILGAKIDEMTNEIKKHIDYYIIHSKSGDLSDGEKRADKLLLYGGGVELVGLTEALSERLKMEVVRGNPLINLSGEPESTFLKRKQKPVAFTVAIGLALRNFYD